MPAVASSIQLALVLAPPQTRCPDPLVTRVHDAESENVMFPYAPLSSVIDVVEVLFPILIVVALVVPIPRVPAAARGSSDAPDATAMLPAPSTTNRVVPEDEAAMISPAFV